MIEHDPSMAEYTEHGRVHQSPPIFTEHTEYSRVHQSPLNLHLPRSCTATALVSHHIRPEFALGPFSHRSRTDLAPISHRLEVLEVVSNHPEYALRKYRYRVEDTEYRATLRLLIYVPW